MGLGYLIPIMWSCLSLAALIGALFTGFWLSSANARKREALKKSLDAKLRQSEQDRNTRIARLTSDLDKHRTQIPTLEDSLAARGALIATQEKELDDAREQNKYAAQQLTDERKRTEASDRLGATLQQTVVTLERDRAEFEAQIDTLNQQNRELRSANASITSDLGKSREVTRNNAKENEQLRQRIQKYDQNKQAQLATDQELHEIRNSRNELVERLHTRDTAVSELQAELQAGKVKMEQLRQSLAAKLELREANIGDLRAELDAQRAESETIVRAHTQQLADRDAKVDDLHAQLEAGRAESTELRQTLAEQQQALGKLHAEQQQAVSGLADLTEHSAHVQTAHEELQRELHVARDNTRQLELGLVNAQRQHQQEQESRRRWQNRCQRLESVSANRKPEEATDRRAHQERESDNNGSDQLATLRCENNKLARALKRAQRNLRAQAPGGSQHRGSQPHQTAASKRSSQLADGMAVSFSDDSHPDPSPHLAGLLSSASDEHDNLREIRGIGPIMAKTLNELGICRFQQLAALGAADIAWIASHINTFPGRIERDQWVAQAAALSREKDGP